MDRHPTTHSLRAGASAHGLRVLDGGVSASDRVTDDVTEAERRRLFEEMDAARALCDRLDDAGLRVAFAHAEDETGVTAALVGGSGPAIRTLSVRELVDLDWLGELAGPPEEPFAS